MTDELTCIKRKSISITYKLIDLMGVPGNKTLIKSNINKLLISHVEIVLIIDVVVMFYSYSMK